MKKDMTIGQEWKLIALFTLPIIAGSLLQQLYNTVDGIIVGNFVGENAFAGVGSCVPLTMIFTSVAMGLGTGVSVVIAQYFGARRYGDLNAAVNTALLVMGAAGLLVSAAGIAATPFILKVAFNTPVSILPYAVLYFRIYSIGFIFQYIYNGVVFILRGMGDSKASLIFLIITTVLNGILAALFVIVFHWGVAGTAGATVIAQAVCAAISYLYLKKRFTFDNDGRRFDRQVCTHILRYGVPSAVQQLIVSLGGGAMQRLANGFGQASIAAISAGGRINMLVFSPVFAFQAGLAAFTGQNIGAGRLDRVRRGFRSTMCITLGLSIFVSTLLYLFSPPLVRLFALEGDALGRGVEMLRFYAVAFIAFGFQTVIAGVLQGAGDIAVQSVAVLSALVIRVASGFLGVYFGILSYNAIWISDAVSWIALILIVTIRYGSGKWKTKAVVNLPSETAEALCTEK